MYRSLRCDRYFLLATNTFSLWHTWLTWGIVQVPLHRLWVAGPWVSGYPTSFVFRGGFTHGSRKFCTWTPKVCGIMAFLACQRFLDHYLTYFWSSGMSLHFVFSLAGPDVMQYPGGLFFSAVGPLTCLRQAFINVCAVQNVGRRRLYSKLPNPPPPQLAPMGPNSPRQGPHGPNATLRRGLLDPFCRFWGPPHPQQVPDCRCLNHYQHDGPNIPNTLIFNVPELTPQVVILVIIIWPRCLKPEPVTTLSRRSPKSGSASSVRSDSRRESPRAQDSELHSLRVYAFRYMCK